jgi:tRNA threonylcarbamoyladenosine biosynthesis protein TsaE
LKQPETRPSHISVEQIQILAHGESETARLGRILAETLPEGTVVALRGTLGAGKTRLVQAIAAACRCDKHFVVSPTFVMVQQYFGDRTITHIDAYRIGSLREFLELGVEEYFDGPGIVLIEWADRVETALPRSRVTIDIDIVADEDRQFTLCVPSTDFPGLLEHILERWKAGGFAGETQSSNC